MHTDAFLPTTTCTADLEQPLRNVFVPRRYERCLVLLRRAEQPLAFVAVPVRNGIVHATDVAAAAIQFTDITVPVPDRTPDALLPEVAVIVPTAGRPDDLARCLVSLSALDYPRMEIVVVDNRPHEERTLRVTQRAAARDPRIRYVAEERPGSSVARNRGLAETTSEIVVLTDDDVEADPLWLRWMVEPFLRDPEVDAVTGLVLPARYETPAQQAFEEHAGFGKGFRRRVFDLGPNRPEDQVLFPYWGAPLGSGNSMAFRRPALLAIGGFDPALGAGSLALAGADIESFSHVLIKGGRLVYEPRAVVWHDHRHRDDALARQMSNYCTGAAAILTKWVMRDPRAIVAIARAATAVMRSRGDAPREVGRLNQQLAIGPRGASRARQLRGFAAGPFRYLQSLRWSRRLELHAALDGPAA